jgi:hypothetical protein
MRKISVPKTDEIERQFRMFYNEELCEIHRLFDVAGAVKCRRETWPGHVAMMDRQQMHREGDNLEIQEVDGSSPR